MVVGCLYALPNLYGDNPAVEISASRRRLGGDVEKKVRVP